MAPRLASNHNNPTTSTPQVLGLHALSHHTWFRRSVFNCTTQHSAKEEVRRKQWFRMPSQFLQLRGPVPSCWPSSHGSDHLPLMSWSGSSFFRMGCGPGLTLSMEVLALVPSTLWKNLVAIVFCTNCPYGSLVSKLPTRSQCLQSSPLFVLVLLRWGAGVQA